MESGRVESPLCGQNYLFEQGAAAALLEQINIRRSNFLGRGCLNDFFGIAFLIEISCFHFVQAGI